MKIKKFLETDDIPKGAKFLKKERVLIKREPMSDCGCHYMQNCNCEYREYADYYYFLVDEGGTQNVDMGKNCKV